MVHKVFIPLILLVILLISGYFGLNEYKAKEYELEVDGETRRYRLHLPSNYNENESYPLVVALHGLTSTPRWFELSTGLSKKADEKGFIVVYPYGSKLKTVPHYVWDAGFCCGEGYVPTDSNQGFLPQKPVLEKEKEKQENDAPFIYEVTQKVKGEFKIDLNKVYILGLSDGAMLTNLVALKYPDTYSKLAVVSGSVGGAPSNDEQPYQYLNKSNVAKPVIIFHGKDDEVIPFDGGEGKDEHFEFAGAYDTVNFWIENNKCSKHPTKITKEANYVVEQYSDCPENVQVVFYAFEGKHIWPGGFSDFVKNLFGKSLDTTNLIWSFFAAQ